MTSAPILVFPNCTKPFLLDTDASQKGIGDVLLQEIDGQEKIIAIVSRSLSKAERKYSETRKNCWLYSSYSCSSFMVILAGTALPAVNISYSLTWLH